MFKKTTAIVAALMMTAAMTSCAQQTMTPEGALIEHIEGAGLPPIQASEEEIYELGYEICEARAEGASKQDMVDIWQDGMVFDHYSEEDLHQFNNILYANLCPEFR